MKAHPVVFYVSASLVALFVITGAALPAGAEQAFASLQDFIVTWFGGFYVLAVAFFLLFVLALLVSPYGSLRLGNDDDAPEYGYATWFAMLFSAGMGIGLLFFSVAEPMLHAMEPRLGEPGTVAAARRAMGIAFYHWGLHAWAIYIVLGLSLAYFSHRRGLPLTVRSTLYPLLGDRIHGPLGDLVDIVAVFGTLFGVATSLGLGVQQINAGLEHLGFADRSLGNQLWLIAGITLVATISVASGVNFGIRRLSELNLALALVLLIFVLLAGPTVYLLRSWYEAMWRYPQTIAEMTFEPSAYTGGQWQKSWTLFYWGWWISWAPFVGMFIARISKGRTIRELILGVLVAPTMFTFAWLIVFGGTGFHIEFQGAGGVSEAASSNLPTALFVMLETLPWSFASSILAMIVIATYFVTSSDSASLVIDIITAGGNPHPPVAQRVFWAVTEGIVAAILLVSGGLVALQTAAITTALPLGATMLVICFSLCKALRQEMRPGAEVTK